MAGPSQAEPSEGGSKRLQEIMNAENSPIAEVNLPLDDLLEGNLTTLKSLPRHQGISHKDMKVNNSSTNQPVNYHHLGSKSQSNPK